MRSETMKLLILLAFFGHATAQTTNLTCNPNDLRFNPSFCYVRDTNIPDVNNILFVNFKRTMTGLGLYTSIMDSIPPNILKMGNITIFSVSDTLIKTVKPEDFANGQFLQTLFLSNFSFTEIQANLFQNAPNLNRMMLSTGTLNNIDVKAFSGLQKLTSLSLLELNIKSLTVGVFDDLVNMTSLSLENNLITELPIGLFAKNLKLDNLQISYNRLKTIPLKLLSHISLSRIGARYNLMERVNTLRALSVDFQYNSLKKVTITKFTTNALLMHNNITKLNCAKSMSMNSIYLDYNLMTNLRCIRAMKNLTSLSIANNNFKFIGQKGMKNLVALRDIEVESNHLKFLKPVAFTNAKSLATLACDDLVRYDNLKSLYPKLWKLQLSTKTWTCDKLDNVTRILKNQTIWFVSSGCKS